MNRNPQPGRSAKVNATVGDSTARRRADGSHATCLFARQDSTSRDVGGDEPDRAGDREPVPGAGPGEPIALISGKRMNASHTKSAAETDGASCLAAQKRAAETEPGIVR